MEDKQLVVYYNMRMQRAVEETKLKYGKMVRALGSSILNNEADVNACEDETYRTIWKHIPPDSPSLFGAYVFKTARKTAFSMLAKKDARKKDTKHYLCMKELAGRALSESSENKAPKSQSTSRTAPQQETISDSEVQATSGSSNASKQVELATLLEGYLASLEKEDRAIFIRRYCFFDSYAEIASIVGTTEQEVSKRLSDLCGDLKKVLVSGCASETTKLSSDSMPSKSIEKCAYTKPELEKALSSVSDIYIDEAINYRSADKKTARRDFIKRNSSLLIGTAFVLAVLLVYLITGSKYYNAESFNLITGFKEWLAVTWLYVVAVAVVLIAIVYMIRHKDVKNTFGKNKLRF